MTDVKVKDRTNLVRRGAAIVNTDTEGFLAFVTKREKEENRVKEVEDLKNTVAELKQMVELLTQGRMNKND